MTTMNMDEVMGNRDYTLIIDGTAPMGMAKYRYEPTKEVVYVVINGAMANNKEENIMNNTNTNATINNTNAQEDKAMNKNNTQAQAINNRKEKKNMKKRIGFLGNMIIAGALTASKGTGYGIGYATETVKDEACYYGRKMKNAVASTKIAQNFVDGYYDGKNDAYYAFAQRANKREEKAREKMDNKAAQAAAEELFDEFC